MSDTGKAYWNKVSEPVEEVALGLGSVDIVYICS